MYVIPVKKWPLLLSLQQVHAPPGSLLCHMLTVLLSEIRVSTSYGCAREVWPNETQDAFTLLWPLINHRAKAPGPCRSTNARLPLAQLLAWAPTQFMRREIHRFVLWSIEQQYDVTHNVTYE